MKTIINADFGKSGQIKIQQMAFVLVAVTLFFIIVGIIILVFVFSGLRSSAQNQEENNAVLLASKLANSPEFSCGESFGTGKTDCVDFDKLIALKSLEESYENFWGASAIGVYKIYPKNSGECNAINYPNCEYVRLGKKEISGFGQGKTFVGLCHKENFGEDNYDKCEMAILVVEERSLND